MEIKFDKNRKYVNILDRIQKNISIEEGVYIIIRLYLTDNLFYYVLCILFRFIPLILLSGNFLQSQITRNISIPTIQRLNSNKYYNFNQLIQLLTCHNLANQFHISYRNYINILLLIYILFIIRIINYFIIIKKIKNKKFTNNWPSPTTYQIIMDHLLFLFFPYVIEFLSFSYYIYFFPNNFIIRNEDNENKILLIIIMIINIIVIIFYNINNYIFIICSNKKYTTNESKAFS